MHLRCSLICLLVTVSGSIRLHAALRQKPSKVLQNADTSTRNQARKVFQEPFISANRSNRQKTSKLLKQQRTGAHVLSGLQNTDTSATNQRRKVFQEPIVSAHSTDSLTSNQASKVFQEPVVSAKRTDRPTVLLDRTSIPITSEEPAGLFGIQLPRQALIAVGSWHAVFACIIGVMVAMRWYGKAQSSKKKSEDAVENQTDSNDQSDGAGEGEVVASLSVVPELSDAARFTLKIFVFGSAFFTTLNCTIFMPDSTTVAKNASGGDGDGGGLILSGLLLGAYGFGGIFGVFIMRSLTHMSIAVSFQFVWLCMFIGNIVAFLSLLFPNAGLPWDLIVFLSRMAAGMELGLEYTHHSLILGVLNPSKDDAITTSLFSYLRLFQYSGAALGPAGAIVCSMVGSTMGVNPAMPALFFMCTLATCFSLATLMCFPRVPAEEYKSSDATEQEKVQPKPGHEIRCYSSVVAFNTMAFLRHGMRLAMEASSLLIFEHSFKFSHESSAFFTSAIMLITIPSSFLVGKILESGRVSNLSLLQMLEAMELVATLGLFSLVGVGIEGAVLFICCSGLFYGANSTVSNPLSAHYYALTIRGHRYLNKDQLIVASTVSIQLGMAAGPIASRALSAWNGVGQNTLACIVLSNLVWQYICCKLLVEH